MTRTQLDKLGDRLKKGDLNARRPYCENVENPDIEVVILKSESHDELKETHARYFKSLKELSPAS